jgi:hypothetical protein
MLRILLVNGNGSTAALALASLIVAFSFSARAQDNASHHEVGIVYYANERGFNPVDKEVSVQTGSNFKSVGRVKGAHATVRLRADKPQVFLVCSVDPSRFKLYGFKSEKNERTVTIAIFNRWIGGYKTVLQESEIPVAIQAAENGCFTLTPQKTLGTGEFGFSPEGSLNAFMFGVGDISQSK